jgi:hypothetical protein
MKTEIDWKNYRQAADVNQQRFVMACRRWGGLRVLQRMERGGVTLVTSEMRWAARMADKDANFAWRT